MAGRDSGWSDLTDLFAVPQAIHLSSFPLFRMRHVVHSQPVEEAGSGRGPTLEGREGGVREGGGGSEDCRREAGGSAVMAGNGGPAATREGRVCPSLSPPTSPSPVKSTTALLA